VTVYSGGGCQGSCRVVWGASAVEGLSDTLRAAGVGFEDRQDLLGHCSERITTHSSAAAIGRLLEGGVGSIQ
jgi:hypothetical protein